MSRGLLIERGVTNRYHTHMAEIKSALELALERTADVKGDKSLLEAHEARQTGMRLAGRFLDDAKIDVKGEVKRLPEAQQTATREGFLQVLMSHLALPSQEADLQRLKVVQSGMEQVISNRRLVADLMGQVQQLLQQYLDTKNQLVEALRKQFAPRLRQKEEQIAQQTGRRVKLAPENDPEFAQALNQNIQRLQAQYGAVIDQAREQLTTLSQTTR